MANFPSFFFLLTSLPYSLFFLPFSYFAKIFINTQPKFLYKHTAGYIHTYFPLRLEKLYLIQLEHGKVENYQENLSIYSRHQVPSSIVITKARVVLNPTSEW